MNIDGNAGSKLKEKILDSKFSQKEIASKIGIAPASLSMMLNDKAALPYNRFKQIISILGLTQEQESEFDAFYPLYTHYGYLTDKQQQQNTHNQDAIIEALFAEAREAVASGQAKVTYNVHNGEKRLYIAILPTDTTVIEFFNSDKFKELSGKALARKVVYNTYLSHAGDRAVSPRRFWPSLRKHHPFIETKSNGTRFVHL